MKSIDKCIFICYYKEYCFCFVVLRICCFNNMMGMIFPQIIFFDQNPKDKSINLTVLSGIFCASIRIPKILLKPVDYPVKMGYNKYDVRNRLIHSISLTSVLLSPFFCSTHILLISFYLQDSLSCYFFVLYILQGIALLLFV